jgi:hypothetical protein
VRWIESYFAFATLHVIGSNNGLSPWMGLGFSAPTAEQAAEVSARIDGTLDWIDATFDAAAARGLDGGLLMMRAETWSPTPGTAQQTIVDRIAARSAAFDGLCCSSRATPTAKSHRWRARGHSDLGTTSSDLVFTTSAAGARQNDVRRCRQRDVT